MFLFKIPFRWPNNAPLHYGPILWLVYSNKSNDFVWLRRVPSYRVALGPGKVFANNVGIVFMGLYECVQLVFIEFHNLRPLPLFRLYDSGIPVAWRKTGGLRKDRKIIFFIIYTRSLMALWDKIALGQIHGDVLIGSHLDGSTSFDPIFNSCSFIPDQFNTDSICQSGKCRSATVRGKYFTRKMGAFTISN